MHRFHDSTLAAAAAAARATGATMASTQSWTEYNGVGPGTPTANRTDGNWKNVDDSTTAYSASPVTAGNNSFGKVQALVFAGTWNTLSALTYKIDNNAPATGISIVGAVLPAYAQPATAATGDAAMSTSGATAGFVSTTTPFGSTLTTALASGTPVTSLAVTATPVALTSGQTIIVQSGANSFTATTSGAVAASATTIPVNSVTPGATYPIGSGVSQQAATGSGAYYASALRTQLQTTAAAGPGDIATRTITAAWTES